MCRRSGQILKLVVLYLTGNLSLNDTLTFKFSIGAQHFINKDTVDMIIKLLYNELTKNHYNCSEEKYASARLKDVLFKVYQSLLTGQHVPTDYK